jgi:Cof subfamily protein (haloacid dehalogenase superfamily)
LKKRRDETIVKLIAIDLDGTLLDKGKYISQKNIEALHLAREKGIEVVVATGRSNVDAKSLLKKVNLDLWIIGTNGATIHTPEGRLFHSVPLEKPLAIEMLRELEKEHFYYEAFIENKICSPEYGIEILKREMELAQEEVDPKRFSLEVQLTQRGFMLIPNYRKLMDEHISIYNILAISFNDEKLKKGWGLFADTPNLTMVQSGINNFHLQHEKASKGNALQLLAEELKINIADTAAIGDNYNDLSMLEAAGRSAAMGNADQEIKEICDFVTLSNEEDGVAHFIESILQHSN